jgi:predicted dehydrogenase
MPRRDVAGVASADRPVRWAILGTGKIARHFAASLPASTSGRLAVIASRTQASADAFGAEFGAERGYGDYERALTDPDVDIVYIATPHPTHSALIHQAMAHGKHVLCEKPLTVTATEARAAVAAARVRRLLLAEGFAFRYSQQTRRLTDLLASGAIGELTMIEASFGYDAGPAPTNYLMRNDLAGGGILDVGCYPVAMSRLLAGVSTGRPFADPVKLTGAGFVHPGSRVDLRAAAVLEFSGGLVAHLRCAIDEALDSTLRIWGTEGVVTVSDPWLPGRRGASVMTVRSTKGNGAPTAVGGGERDPDLYANEADEVARWLDDGEAPTMTLDDTLGNMEALDEWRRQIGLEFPADTAPPAPERHRTRAPAPMHRT